MKTKKKTIIVHHPSRYRAPTAPTFVQCNRCGDQCWIPSIIKKEESLYECERCATARIAIVQVCEFLREPYFINLCQQKNK